jgi:BlaI family penicillinase repressor
MGDALAISDAEWQVMNVVWEEQPVEAQQVVDQLADANEWSGATVKTMLHRLVKKQILAFDQNGKRYVYRATVRRSDCVRQASRSFLDRVFGGSAAPALMHLVKNCRLSEQELADLRALLDHKEGKS